MDGESHCVMPMLGHPVLQQVGDTAGYLNLVDPRLMIGDEVAVALLGELFGLESLLQTFERQAGKLLLRRHERGGNDDKGDDG